MLRIYTLETGPIKLQKIPISSAYRNICKSTIAFRANRPGKTDGTRVPFIAFGPWLPGIACRTSRPGGAGSTSSTRVALGTSRPGGAGGTSSTRVALGTSRPGGAGSTSSTLVTFRPLRSLRTHWAYRVIPQLLTDWHSGTGKGAYLQQPIPSGTGSHISGALCNHGGCIL